jgi:hypothetical protein
VLGTFFRGAKDDKEAAGISRGRINMNLRALCLEALFVCGIAASAQAQSDFQKEVDLRVRSWQPTKAERRIDEIAWAADIRTALRLGRESNRPIFVFTHDGRMGVGRQ